MSTKIGFLLRRAGPYIYGAEQRLTTMIQGWPELFHPSVVCIGEHSALLDTPTQAVDDDGSGHLAPPEDPSLLAVRLNSPSVDSGIG